jgi:hypothetical protein
MMRLGKNDPLDFQLTEAEISDLRAIGIPKVIRPMLQGDVALVNSRTRAYRNALRLLRMQAEVNKAEIDAIESGQRIEELSGELTDITEMRKQLAAARKERDEAIAAEQQARKLREIETARPALAVHAKGTGR